VCLAVGEEALRLGLGLVWMELRKRGGMREWVRMRVREMKKMNNMRTKIRVALNSAIGQIYLTDSLQGLL
jgi:hypothetical protein